MRILAALKCSRHYFEYPLSGIVQFENALQFIYTSEIITESLSNKKSKLLSLFAFCYDSRLQICRYSSVGVSTKNVLLIPSQ